MAIYLEPSLPRPELVVIGQSPMARSLSVLGDKLGFRVTACDPSATADLFPDAESLVQQLDGIRGITGPRSYIVIATTGTMTRKLSRRRSAVRPATSAWLPVPGEDALSSTTSAARGYVPGLWNESSIRQVWT